MKLTPLVMLPLVVLAGCAGTVSVADSPDFKACEQACAAVRRGETAAAQAALARISDPRNAAECRDIKMELARGVNPFSP